MRGHYPVVHALGNAITKQNIKLTRNNGMRRRLILYKCVYNKDELGRYRSLFASNGGEMYEYEIGKTYTKNHETGMGFFLAGRDFVAKHYWEQFQPQAKNAAVLECIVDIASCHFRSKRPWREKPYIQSKGLRKNQLDIHECLGEIQVNKFKVVGDVTEHFYNLYVKREALKYKRLAKEIL